MTVKPTLSRRQFLKAAALALSATMLAACGGRDGKELSDEEVENFYLKNQDKIKQEVEEILHFAEQACAQKYDAELAAALMREASQDFQDQLGKLPYIGGYANELTSNLYQGAAALGFYRAMTAHGKSVEETGEILYGAVDQMMKSMPMNGMTGRLASSRLMMDKIRAEAKVSQEKNYPDDWVFEFVEGDGQDFSFGVDYLECGICKYYQDQQAEELTPYLCLLDFPMSQAMNTGLVRTTTLARGGERCDFRYQRGRACQMEWTPDFLKPKA